MRDDALSGDRGNILLLLLLYTLQGVPMGLTAAIQLSFQEQNVSLDMLNLFGQVSWPFSLKILWAPIVDSCYVKAVGLRKSWLVPSQLAIGITLILASSRGLDEAENVVSATCVFFLLFVLCATQDICVDGWALTLLKPKNVGYASTCNTIGQTLGNLLAYVGWIAADNFGIRFGSFMLLWGIVFVCTTLIVAVCKREADCIDGPSLFGAYTEMLIVCRKPLVQRLALVFLTCKIGLAPEGMLQLMMVGPVGMPKTEWVLLGLVLTVPSLLAPKLVANFTASERPFDLYLWGMLPRQALLVMAILLVWCAPAPQHSTALFGTFPWPFYLAILLVSIAVTCISQAMFAGQMGFIARVSDARIGGTYMTLLNTIANMGSKWSTTLCISLVSWSGGSASPQSESPLRTQNYSGFFLVAPLFIFAGVIWLYFAHPAIERLQKSRPSEWLVDTAILGEY
jgi:PAT family acetyl-CoA transporter-like MFS transporter 1